MTIKNYKTRDIAKRMTAKRSLLADRRNSVDRGRTELLESSQYEVRESPLYGGSFVGGLSSELATNPAYRHYKIVAQYSCGYLVDYNRNPDEVE